MSENIVDLKGKPVKPNNVIPLDVETFAEIPAGQILDAAKNENMDSALVLGWKPDGTFYFASTHASVAEINLLLEVCKDVLMDEIRGGR